MPSLTIAAALAIAAGCVPPSVAPIVVGIAQHESGLNPYAVHDNQSGRSYYPDTAHQAAVIAHSLIGIGHASLDIGIGQITTANFGWLSLTVESALDPCKSFAGSASVLLARYNGNPPGSVKALYAAGAMARIRAVDADLTAQSQHSAGPAPPRVAASNDPLSGPARTCPEPDPTGWHAVALVGGCQPLPDAWHIVSREKDPSQ